MAHHGPTRPSCGLRMRDEGTSCRKLGCLAPPLLALKVLRNGVLGGFLGWPLEASQAHYT